MQPQATTLPADIKWNPSGPRLFSGERLRPIDPIDDSELHTRLGWSRCLEAHLPAKRVAGALACRSLFKEQTVTTPSNTYAGVLNPVWCNDPMLCAHCSEVGARRKYDTWHNETSTVLQQGCAITAFSFVFSLPEWNAALNTPTCALAESHGRPCGTDSACRTCAEARVTHAHALAAEATVFDAIDRVIDAHLPKHGGWWARGLEATRGVNGPIAIRYTLLVAHCAFTATGPAPTEPGAAWEAVHDAYVSALEAAGGTDHGTGGRTFDGSDLKPLEQLLDLLHKPLPLRLQAMVEAGQGPEPGAIRRWATAAGLARPDRTGRSRRAPCSGTWGQFSGGLQQRALAALAARRVDPDDVPVTRLVTDTWRVVQRSGGLIMLQSHTTGECRAELAAIGKNRGVDGAGRPVLREPSRWEAIPGAARPVLTARGRALSDQIATTRVASYSTTIEASMPTPEQQLIALRQFAVRRGMFAWSAVEWEETPAVPGLMDRYARREPGLPLGYGKPADGGWRVARMTDDLLRYWIGRSRVGWQIQCQFNDVAGVRVSQGQVVENRTGRHPEWTNLSFDIDAQKAGSASVQAVHAQLVAWGLRVHQITATGSGGAHVTIRTVPIEFSIGWGLYRRIHAALAAMAVVDKKSINGLLRPAGTLNWKSGSPRMAQDVWVDDAAPPMSAEEIVNSGVPALAEPTAPPAEAPGPRVEPLPEDDAIIATFGDELRPYVTGEIRVEKDGQGSGRKLFAICSALRNRWRLTVDEAIEFVSRNGCATLHRCRRDGVAKAVGDCYASMSRREPN